MSCGLLTNVAAALLIFSTLGAAGQDLPQNNKAAPSPSPSPDAPLVVPGEAAPLAKPEVPAEVYAGSLEGEQRCRGSNPDGTNYQGTVRMHVQDGAVLVEWTVNGKKSYGTGLLQGTTLGVGLENGVAIYQVLVQPQGLALVGRWATEDSKAACDEVILVGTPEETTAKFPVEKINGSYRLQTQRADGTQEDEPFAISGGDTLKKIKLKGDVTVPGLLLGSGLAAIPPGGLVVFQITKDPTNQPYLTGESLDQTTISKVSLIPGK